MKPQLAPKLYTVIAVAILIGFAFDFAGLNAMKMLFWSAILNGLLAPPLVTMVVLLTSDRQVMGNRVNTPGDASTGMDLRSHYERCRHRPADIPALKTCKAPGPSCLRLQGREDVLRLIAVGLSSS